ncbi:hypothetical protein [Halorubellus salinus]|uniref:hypothetical protein n=1 Tax=Halorubellus salinus TaxID=755309 RepID=UPI001D061718|nr:hypothetical protein [Halorubellus salinus]
MNRRALLASAASAGIGLTSAGCLSSPSGPPPVRSYDDPDRYPGPGLLPQLPEDARRWAAVAVGRVDNDDGPAPVAVVVRNAASGERDVACSLRADDDPVFDRTWTLPADAYAVVGLHARADYAFAIGHPGDVDAFAVDRDRFDCNEKTFAATVAADGTLTAELVGTTDMACGGVL